MTPYDKLIMGNLKGETPKEKYENLINMQILLSRIAFPRRGTTDEDMTIMDAADEASKLIDYQKEYKL